MDKSDGFIHAEIIAEPLATIGMTKRIFTYLTVLILIISCSTYRDSLILYGNKNQAIRNTIIDFRNSSRIYKKHKVFEVEFIDTLYRKELEKIDERNYRWINGKPYENIFAINISAMTNKLVYSISDSLKYLPNRYIEQDGKLFFWKDDNYELDKETIEIFKKYEVVREGGLSPEFVIDETKKAVDYFICRSDFTKYKKVTTSTAIGYFDAPKVNCE